MQNLVKIQEELKNLPLQAVMTYVEGRNPMVPPYLALTELNRRKQVQQASAAQQQPQGTIKDQIQQQAGLMALQAGRQQAMQQNMAKGMASIPQPEAVPVQGAPVQAPPVQAAEGGLMRVPMRRDMFKADSYAGGGIVAFNGRSGSRVEDDEEEEIDPTTGQRYKSVNPLDFLNIGKALRGGKTIEEYYGEKPAVKTDATASTPPASPDAPSAPPAAPSAPVAPGAPAARQPSMGGYGPLMAMKPQSTSLEDIYKEQQEANRLAGVVSPEQRYAKSDEMIKKLREQMSGQRMGQEMAGIAEAMGAGAQNRKWWEAAGAFGSGMGKFRRTQDQLYNKQDEAFADLERTKEKEEDAIRRGNAKDISAAKREREKAEVDLAKAKAEAQYRQESMAQKAEGADARLDLEREKLLESKDRGYGMLKQREALLTARLAKDPNDKKAQDELRNIRQEIENKRRAAGLYVGGGASAPAQNRSWQGWSGSPVK